jgi:hypothetical protein
MADYFSRLASTTGLRVGPGAASALDTAALTRSAYSLPAQGGAERHAPPHVEQMTLVEPPPGTPPGDDTSPAERGSPSDASRAHVGPSSALGENFAGSPARTPPAARTFVEEGSPQRERETPPPTFAGTPHPSPFEESRLEFAPLAHVPLPREETYAPSSGTPGTAPLAESRETDAARGDAFTQAREPPGVLEEGPWGEPAPEPPDSPARADVRHAYLQEVVEWVNTPADAADADVLTSAAPAPGESRQTAATRARTDVAREPEVQDFSLSIGSISIVIEEPPKRPLATARAPAPERAPSTPSAGETSRLRRRYVRSL